ncbi:hypothetical protein COT65_00100 [Candidatus Shapirobacteria bacterium CG09_land_8_20_14_0_10_47_13]|uniref:Uncharacterized protein n=1 Tax=Candidatus Shapirobacteria bacterium CG09_land_8_20_14_0_10_47_13 TaxID=1974481 RepID=A0A2H0WNI1_9BACT|nr:MAG: hypothetical protein COT65_00100 [Candidatus Shapirobacteria bacterium CG09_land_8_20_14_0_10_47_13]
MPHKGQFFKGENMGWQERVEAYKEIKRRDVLEKVLPLLSVLESFGCQKTFLQIRDEIWRLGEVLVSPNLDKVTAETPILAEVSLEATWPYYETGVSFGTFWVPRGIEIKHRKLSIVTRYDDDFNKNSKDIFIALIDGRTVEPSFFKANHPNARFLMEELVIKEILMEQAEEEWTDPPPYDRRKELAEQRVIQAIIEEGLKPPVEFEYFLELAEAEKARRGSR